jgi:hypothetical protein
VNLNRTGCPAVTIQPRPCSTELVKFISFVAIDLNLRLSSSSFTNQQSISEASSPPQAPVSTAKLFELSTKQPPDMPRSRGGRSAPARAPSAPSRPTAPAPQPRTTGPTQQQRPMSTTAPGQTQANPAATQQGPRLFGQMASTAA